MRIKPSESAQRSLEKQYFRECKEVLYKTSLPVLQMADKIAPAELKNRIQGLLKPDLINKYITDLWSKVGGKFASETARMVNTKKAIENYDKEAWEQGFRAYMADRSKKIAKQILTTQEETLNIIIDKIVREAMLSGEGISTISGALKDQMESEMVTIQRWEAERIARTEVIGASNKGSFDGAKSTGLPMKKMWSTSGLPGIRDTHLANEFRGWVEMDHVYTGNCEYPGDPNGEAGEIINCRCSPIYEVE